MVIKPFFSSKQSSNVLDMVYVTDVAYKKREFILYAKRLKECFATEKSLIF